MLSLSDCCRCIRPNELKSPDLFQPDKVLIQLRYTGVLETTRIRKEVSPHPLAFLTSMCHTQQLLQFVVLSSGFLSPDSLSRLHPEVIRLLSIESYTTHYSCVYRVEPLNNGHIVCDQAFIRRFSSLSEIKNVLV